MDYSNLTLDEMWDLFLQLCLCSEETLQVVTSINGYSEDTMYAILYATTGLRNFEQIAEEYGLIDEYDDEEDYDDEDY